jgi:hypothetical protein
MIDLSPKGIKRRDSGESLLDSRSEDDRAMAELAEEINAVVAVIKRRKEEAEEQHRSLKLTAVDDIIGLRRRGARQSLPPETDPQPSGDKIVILEDGAEVSGERLEAADGEERGGEESEETGKQAGSSMVVAERDITSQPIPAVQSGNSDK